MRQSETATARGAVACRHFHLICDFARALRARTKSQIYMNPSRPPVGQEFNPLTKKIAQMGFRFIRI